MDNLSDLISKAQKGDKDAYGEIYNLFYKRIYRYCSFNTRKAEVAQDICQETFIKAWKALPSFSQKGGSFQAYLFKIARNLIIDLSRKKKEERLEQYQEIEIESQVEDKIEQREKEAVVQLALAKLDELDRQIIILHYFEDMTGREVAKVVGIREGNLRVKTHRALKKLKSLLEK
ncbi:MAG: RNA polymerase sigma factor [Candidatus Curtissbacteria bacterium]|nr:RNA polymerase sigma factor [Candidatus Curtissbacteria bacterium]